MSKFPIVSGCILASFVLGFGAQTATTQESEPDIQVFVNMVQLNVAVTDNKGNYITHLRPEDFEIREDGIVEKLATFEEGDEPTRRLFESNGRSSDPSVGGSRSKTPQELPDSASASELSSLVAGSNVFILFDTSNYMYRGFVFAQDSIADFVRSLEHADKIAFYSYSRDLSRAASLTEDRMRVLQGVRSTVAGDDAALYNSLLLTVKEAAQYQGRKVIVVFSNGPDNASVVPPEDVAELAQSTGIAIYMVCTRQAELEPISTAVFERMTAATGGKAYFAKSWKDEERAFASIRDDLAHLYALSYYPRPNPNVGWRNITIKLTSEAMKKYHVRTRNGYRLQASRFTKNDAAARPD